jgi:glycolate oxidase
MPEFLSNEEIVLAARKRLTQANWDYLVGGSESETSMRRNRLAFDRWAFRPRVLVDVSKIDPSTTFLAQQMRIPVLLAPVGGLQNFAPDGGVASAQAAQEFGVLQVVSSATQPSLEEIAESTDQAKVFQLYVNGDYDWTRDMVKRIVDAGYISLCITVDVAIYSRRERPMLGRSVRRAATQMNWLAHLDWAKFDQIREWAGIPMMIKGIATAEDAELAVQHGADVVWVSNHGGRQLDHALGSLDAMLECVEAVAGKADVIVDGGVQRGSDVLKAVALGARAVAIGKLQGWGLAADGKDGMVRVLELLENEMISAMGLNGVTCIDQLNRDYLTRAESVTPPHEMSMWANMPNQPGRTDGRIV